MSHKSDELKIEIAKTKADLMEKLHVLERQIREEATDAKDTLEGAIGNVKATARFFSISHRVRERPLLMAGGFMVAGYMLTRWTTGGRRDTEPSLPPGPPSNAPPSFLASVIESCPDEVRAIKSVAFDVIIGLVAARARAGFPDHTDKIGEIERQIKLGMKQGR